MGPPVIAVDVLDQPGGEGGRRNVQARFGREPGSFQERRILHGDERMAMAFVIERDTFGLDRMLANIGSIMELYPVVHPSSTWKQQTWRPRVHQALRRGGEGDHGAAGWPAMTSRRRRGRVQG